MSEQIKVYEELSAAISKTVKIPHNQVVHLVVDDLIEKYRYNIRRNNKEWSSAFEKVLSYYLTEEELKDVTNGIPSN